MLAFMAKTGHIFRIIDQYYSGLPVGRNRTGRYTTSGEQNVAIGTNAGDGISTGTGNVILGYGADGDATSNNQIAIGRLMATTASDILY